MLLANCRTPYWYRHSYHHHHHPHPQPNSLQYFAPPDLEYVQKRTSNKGGFSRTLAQHLGCVYSIRLNITS